MLQQRQLLLSLRFQHNDPNFEDEEFRLSALQVGAERQLVSTCNAEVRQHVAFIEFRRSLTKIYKL